MWTSPCLSRGARTGRDVHTLRDSWRKNVTITRALLVLTAILSPWVASAQSSPARLSLDEAVALALRQNRSLESADLQVAKAQQDLDTARSRRLPKVRLEAQAAQLLRPIDVLFNQGAVGTFPANG